MLKIQERCILWHLEHDISIVDKLNKKQFGFRKGYSTEAALHKIVHKIEKKIAKKGYVLGTFLDIEGAFDNVSFEAIYKALQKTDIDSTTINWIFNMVVNRQTTVQLKNITKTIKIGKGCPQGGVLSPFLWNLVVDSLLELSCKDTPAYLQGFADDLVILAEGDDLDVIYNLMQKTIDTVEKWCTTNGLNISKLKTKVVMFTWQRKWAEPTPITIKGNPIKLSNHTRFLGIHLDAKLNFNEHINKTTKRATISLVQCRRAVGPNWGLTPKTCSWIYERAIRPILTYASTIWINATTTQRNQKLHTKVERIALKMITGCMPSTPTIALNQITNITTIIEFIEGEAAKGHLRLQATNQLTSEKPIKTRGTIISHTYHNNNYVNTLKLPQSESDMMKKHLNLNLQFKTVIKNSDQIAEYFESIKDDDITCYADGSKIGTQSGYGYRISKNKNIITIYEESGKMPSHCTVYQHN